MSQESKGHRQDWWNDPEQRQRFEQRMSHTPLSRRSVLGLIGAFASGAAVIACGSDDKSETKATAAPSGGSPAAGAATAAAGEKLAKEQKIRLIQTVEPATFDNNFNLYGDNAFIVNEGLLKFDPSQSAVPAIAESFTVNDKGDVYTFKLRKNAKWSNGDPITAKDFIYSWTRRLDPTSGANYAGFLHDIKNGESFNTKKGATAADLGLKAIDDYTLEVTLQAPAGYFPILVAYQAAVPAHRASVEKFGDKYGTDADKYVGTGPFKLTRWDHDKSYELSKNENYHSAKDIKLEKVVYTIAKRETWVNAYENNEIDYASNLNFGDFKRLSGDSKLSKEIFKFDQVGSWYLMPNPKHKPFDNIKVRQAMAHAIDRDKLVKEVLQGLATPAFTQNSPGTPHYNSNKYEAATKFDPKMAMDLLKGTEYEGGKNSPKITMSVRNNEADAHRAAGTAIIQMLKENLGMTVDYEVADPQAVYKEMWNGNKQLMWLRWYMDYPDANNTNYECFYSKIPAGSRRSWWENAKFDELVVQAKSEPSQEKRKQLYAQSDEILVTEAGAIFLYYPLAYGLKKATVKGLPKNKEGADVVDWNIFIRMLDTMYMVEA
jgi:ABC-type oligopeptide transport system substrate-binding subunit